MHLFKRTLLTAALAAVCIGSFAQQSVRGTVKDAEGNPLIGVTITADGKPVTVTDLDGNFTIPQATSSTKIGISYIGYKNQDITVGNKTQFDVVMQEDNNTLNDVVVVGYGTMKKTDLTGSVSSIGTEKLNEKGAPSVLENLQGSVPGVNITKSTGRTAGSLNIEIRGKNSISSSQSPLYVVDGVICSDIDFLNPQDIERVDVLKDASSTAIYGSRATAGVVIITTKSGMTVDKHMDRPTISYDGYYGFSKVARMPDFQDGEEFYKYRFMKFLNATGQSTFEGRPVMINDDLDRCLLNDGNGNYRMKEILAAGQTYNWPDFVLQDGMQQNHYLAVSGSTERIHYHLGLGYTGEEGTYKGDELKKFNIKGSLDGQINKYISAGFNFNLARIDHDYASDNAVESAFRVNPFMQPYNENGELNLKPGDKETLHTNLYQFSSQINPLIYMRDEQSNRLSWMALTNVYLQVNPLKGLTFKTTFSPTFTYERYGYYQGTEAGESQNTAQRQSNQGFSWTWDNILTYDTYFGQDHHLNAMGLISASYSNAEAEKLRYNKVTDGTQWWAIGTTDNGYDYNNSNSSYSESSLMSYALRVNYSYKERYMVTGTIRWDGSSRFAKGNRWSSFPSAAVAWRMSEEPWMAKTRSWLSNLKWRLSYGVTGNNSVGNYATRLTVAGPVYYPFGTTYSQGMYPNGVVDTNLKWERSHEVNFGVDFGFLRDRIMGSIDIYNKKSTDLLYSVQLPLESGGTSLTTNVGSVRNRGIEISLTTDNIRTGDWHWTTTFTWARNLNKVLEINGTGNLYSGNLNGLGNLFIGSPYNNVYNYQWVGIVSDRDMTVPDTEIARLRGFTPGETVKEYVYYNRCYNLNEGYPIIKDVNGDGKFTDDDKKIYNSDPAWTGSLTSNLQWKNWDFSFSIYAKQHFTIYSPFLTQFLEINDRGRMRLNEDWYIPAGTLIDCDGQNPDGTFINPVYQETTHYGSYPFPNNYGANGGVGTSYWRNCTNSICSGSFFKVKHITLGYTFPKAWLSKIGCREFRLYCTVTNPFVITPYQGYDPEWATATEANDGPSTVTWQFGASIKF